MSVISKSFLRCDKCGKTVEIPGDIKDGSHLRWFADGSVARGWLDVNRTHHLCPDCAVPYKAKRVEMERELKRLAGIETIEVDL